MRIRYGPDLGIIQQEFKIIMDKKLRALKIKADNMQNRGIIIRELETKKESKGRLQIKNTNRNKERL